MFLGVIVLVIGIVLILKAFGWVTAGSWALFWGILLLVLGLKMVSKKRHCIHCDWFGYQHDHKEHGEK